MAGINGCGENQINRVRVGALLRIYTINHTCIRRIL